MSLSYNKSIIAGRVSTDPQFTKAENGGTNRARFNVAVDRVTEGADFISCVAFGKTADFFDPKNEKGYFMKGDPIFIEGHINTGSYKNKDGNTVYTTDVIVDSIKFVETKAQKDARRGSAQAQPAQAPQAAPAAPGFAPAPAQGIPQGFQQAAPQFQQQPVYGQPAYGQPAYGQPAYGQPMVPPVDGMPSFN